VQRRWLAWEAGPTPKEFSKSAKNTRIRPYTSLAVTAFVRIMTLL